MCKLSRYHFILFTLEEFNHSDNYQKHNGIPEIQALELKIAYYCDVAAADALLALELPLQRAVEWKIYRCWESE